MKKKKNTPKRIILAILAILIIAFATICGISHIRYHRSVAASICEIIFKLVSNQNFSSDEEVSDFIYRRSLVEDEPYSLPDSIANKYNVKLDTYNGCQIVVFNDNIDTDHTILYTHGGAYVSEITNFHLKMLGKISEKSNTTIIAPLYPLAPNHTYDETYAILDSLYDEILAQTDNDIIFMGDSAGGGLALGFAEYLAENGKIQPDKIIALSPWLDLTMSNADIPKYQDVDPVLTPGSLRQLGAAWAGDLPATDYKVSPIMGDLTPLDNIYLFVGTREIFYPDVTKLYSMLDEAGKNTELYVGTGMNHVYPMFPAPEGAKAISQIVDIINN